MSWFLTVFLSLYTLLHLLFYRAVRCLLPGGFGARALLGLFLLLMILAPIITVMTGSQGHFGLARLVGTVGYWWMGFLIIALLCLLALSLLRLLALPFSPQAWNWRAPVALALGVAFIITTYGVFAATDIRLKRLNLTTDKLPAGVERLTIVQTSDLHLGQPEGKTRLRKVIKMVKQAKPDLWIDTGDMWDRPLLDVRQEMDLLRQVKPPLGKFMIAGNHEFYVGLATAFELSREAGFSVLENLGQAVGPLYLAGVYDARAIHPEWDAAALAGAQPGRFTIFLRHRPLFNQTTAGQVDLQLSGHTHGGQVWPAHLITSRIFPFFAGLYHPAPKTALYTSRGTGTWGPPMRLFSPPEVTIIQLTRRSGAK
ncbi:metallophosphoesterase [Desulfoferula mesophila]|uniref:Serine/threonine phosphatase n=1 Tax=Desulfoferula mesophila TaxID=3058419 RepID=A0AAU9EZ45_9BACT|nr:serine/threonine phosphatase [Desulfoferula mesophilus]